MSLFLESLQAEEEKLEEIDQDMFEWWLENADEEDLKLISEEEEITLEELQELQEALKKRVSSSGKVSRVRSKKVRSRRATITTGKSKTALKRAARKAARTRKRNPSSVKRANRKRRKAMRRRKSMGI